MKINDMYPSKYLKSEDIGAMRVTAVVMTVVMEDIGDKEYKPVMRFMAKDKGMVLNKTNATICASIWGDDTDHWQGKQVEIFTQPVMFQGRQVTGLALAPLMARNAPQQPPQQQPQQEQPQQPAQPSTAQSGPGDVLRPFADGVMDAIDDLPF